MSYVIYHTPFYLGLVEIHIEKILPSNRLQYKLFGRPMPGPYQFYLLDLLSMKTITINQYHASCDKTST